jgi:RNA polymerase-binding protein DksA
VAKLTPKQIRKLKQVMIERIAESYRDTRSDVRDRIPAANEASAINDDNDPHDEADEALRTQLADLRVSLDEREARLAQLMEEALRRMAEGTYGKCVDCGNDIEWSRLKAMPWAQRDIDCQEAHEQELQQRPPTL